MPSTTVLYSIGTLIVSFLGSMLFYYMIDTGTKEDKKSNIDQILNMIIAFILYLWAAKVIFQLDVFFHDPISTLAYPSNSTHFYAASVFLLVHLIIKYRHRQTDGAVLFQTANFILLAAIFLYDFMQTIVHPNVHINIIIIVLAVLVGAYVLLYSKVPGFLLGSLMIGIFLLIACCLAFYQGYFKLFGYMLSPYYFLFLLLLSGIYTYRLYKKKLLV